MARPHPTGKQSVNLAPNLASNPASSGPRVSRIRRDPPPAVKEKVVDPEEDEQWTVVVGVLVFALAIFVIILAFGNYFGSSAGGSAIEVTVGE